jgi:hypothetical protein
MQVVALANQKLLALDPVSAFDLSKCVCVHAVLITYSLLFLSLHAYVCVHCAHTRFNGLMEVFTW